jgi:putative transcriptional regulator
MVRRSYFMVLAAIVALATMGMLKCPITAWITKRPTEELPAAKVSSPEMSARLPSSQSLTFPLTAQPPAFLLPVQAKSTKSLGVGKLLVASRNLGDPHFYQRVVLLIRYDAQGVLGLVVNQRTDLPLSKVLDGVKAAKKRYDPVYVGGPVEPASVFALLKSPAKVEGAEQVFSGVYLITAKPLFEQTISARPDPEAFHVYMGYAGWTEEQLRMEVQLGAWFVFPADAATVFNSDPDSLWRRMIEETETNFAWGGPVFSSGPVLNARLD